MNAPVDGQPKPSRPAFRRLVCLLWVLAVLAAAFPIVTYLRMSRRGPQWQRVVQEPSRSAEDTARAQPIREMMAKLRALHGPLPKPGPHDWLANHKEDGQTFDEYLAASPVILGADGRRVLYIQPLGEFSAMQRKIVTLTADFMKLYFNTDVRVKEDLPLSLVPDGSKRAARGFGQQYHAGFILHDILKPRLPADAVASIAFTAADLYPEDSWNFVFGEASLYERVGVWSLARYGDPDEDAAAFRLCLLRTIKTATHETGHMFTMQHCILHPCNMNGSNHLMEADATPLALCPECQAKLCWATGADPAEQFKKLGAFCKELGLKEDEASYVKSLEALGKR